MNFEDQLRDRLQSNARDVTVAGRGVDHVVGRARTRQRHRRAAAGSVAGVALLAGSIGYVSLRRDDPRGELAVGTDPGLSSSGPLELEWTVDEGGVTYGVATSVAPDGTIYALSTAPGVRTDERTRADTLYAMGGDGVWTNQAAGSSADVVDVAAGASLLYGVGTAPSTRGVGFVPVLSTSSDDGGSWRRSELPAVEAPSTAVGWLPSSSVQVAATGDTAVAVVSTSFTVPASDLPGVDLADDDPYMLVPTEDGIVVSRPAGVAGGRPTTTAPVAADGSTDPVKGTEGGSMEVLRTVAWSELGVSGPDDLRRTDVYVAHGDGFAPAPGAVGALDYVAGLTTIGDEFVLSASRPLEGDPSMSEMVTFASTDGERWRAVAVPSDSGMVAGIGTTWAAIGRDGRQLEVSGDRGATWRTVDLPGGVPEDGFLHGLTSGPLGLAVAVQGSSGPGRVLVTRDLENWAVLDLSELGVEPDLGSPSVIVGADRVVVTVTVPGDGAPGAPGRSRTIVGIPVRTSATTTAPPTTSELQATTTTGPAVSTTTTVLAPASTTTAAPSTTTSAPTTTTR